jgi:membrane protein implicated in regulation of membrane protease activity
MFRQLITDSLLRAFVLFMLSLAAVVAWALADHPEIFWAKVVIGVLAVSIIMLISWRKLSTQCVDREFLYRRQHGKWRWER